MSDGRILVENIGRSGSMYGHYETINGEVTDEKLAKAKAMVVDEVCKIIREIANDRDDFFIINPTDDGATVGCKFLLPTVTVE